MLAARPGGTASVPRLCSFLSALFALVAVMSLPGQRPPRPPAQAEATRSQDDLQGSLIALRALRQSIVDKERDLRAKQDEVETESNEQRKLALLDEARAIEAELARLRRDQDSILTGLNIEQFESTEKAFNLEEELKELVRPLIEQVKDLTAEPRQIEQLRSDLAEASQRQATAERGLAHIERLIAQSRPQDEVWELLQEGRARWQRRINDIRNLKTVASYQLDSKLAERQSLVESTRAFAASFFRSRGLNLLLAIAAFAVVFVTLRLLYRPFGRVTAGKRRTNLYIRLLAVLFHVAVVLLAVLAALAVLYVAGDWVLLGIALIFLVGLLWAGKNALPRFVDDIRMLLNLGSVRERERLIYDGLPWRVERLNVYAKLVNPALTGGELRLPIRLLAGLCSRPCDDKEVWFPCAEGDWVQLDDGVRGRVVLQTPDMVQMVQLGGARVTMQVATFLGKNPKNLSTGFRIRSTFGVDYGHQAISTSAIPQLMQQRLQKELEAAVDEAVVSVKVEFKAAGSSSLDLEAVCDFRGDVASRYEPLSRTIQRVLVEACNQHGWVIPFTQVTLHQAKPA